MSRILSLRLIHAMHALTSSIELIFNLLLVLEVQNTFSHQNRLKNMDYGPLKKINEVLCFFPLTPVLVNI